MTSSVPENVQNTFSPTEVGGWMQLEVTITTSEPWGSTPTRTHSDSGWTATTISAMIISHIHLLSCRIVEKKISPDIQLERIT